MKAVSKLEAALGGADVICRAEHALQGECQPQADVAEVAEHVAEVLNDAPWILTLVVVVAEVPVPVQGGHTLVQQDQLDHRQRVVDAYGKYEPRVLAGPSHQLPL